VLELDLGWMEKLERAKRNRPLPVVLTIEEVRHVLQHMQGLPKLMASLIYDTGLRGLLHYPFVERQNSMEQGENELPKNHKP